MYFSALIALLSSQISIDSSIIVYIGFFCFSALVLLSPAYAAGKYRGALALSLVCALGCTVPSCLVLALASSLCVGVKSE